MSDFFRKIIHCHIKRVAKSKILHSKHGKLVRITKNDKLYIDSIIICCSVLCMHCSIFSNQIYKTLSENVRFLPKIRHCHIKRVAKSKILHSKHGKLVRILKNDKLYIKSIIIFCSVLCMHCNLNIFRFCLLVLLNF